MLSANAVSWTWLKDRPPAIEERSVAMTTSMDTLPPRPDLGPPVVAPKNKKKIGAWGVAGLIIAGLFIYGAVFPKSDDAVRQTAVAPTEFDSSLTVTEAAQQSAPLATEAASEMDYITDTSAISQDIIHLNTIAGLYEQVAVIWEGVDDMEAMYMHSAADHFSSAASTWPDDAALHHIELATDDLNNANDQLPS
jgi:hypothetical protein